MAALTRQDVEQIALLARLELSEAELDRLAGELGAILDHFRALAAVDTAGIEPMTHAVPMTLRLRADQVAPSLPAGEALAAAPDRADDQFRVPGILDRGDG
ncbi:MAG TPA: Asp-tRNA(Asn)/Glu-tRNA(Gln) amidotransferase subunit GatC [Kofleriaceae bacterium]|jgi:aspartyl-tRNA(Asn)/glutamyl-tRNA(Gln) amidotransferase subunit C|nr:Asp-tRNA(Asn)/Glu-tRNA(Gln) amidotransferase subunit GatC [Kofleriaceae bacterium]